MIIINVNESRGARLIERTQRAHIVYGYLFIYTYICLYTNIYGEPTTYVGYYIVHIYFCGVLR